MPHPGVPPLQTPGCRRRKHRQLDFVINIGLSNRGRHDLHIRGLRGVQNTFLEMFTVIAAQCKQHQPPSFVQMHDKSRVQLSVSSSMDATLQPDLVINYVQTVSVMNSSAEPRLHVVALSNHAVRVSDRSSLSNHCIQLTSFWPVSYGNCATHCVPSAMVCRFQTCLYPQPQRRIYTSHSHL